MRDPVEQIREWTRRIEDAPTPATGIVTHHGVPWGRAFRQYDTQGRLWVWISRGYAEDLPRGGPERMTTIDRLSAIPVYHDRPPYAPASRASSGKADR